MSTFFLGEGNIGSNPEFRVFPNGNDEPRRMMRINVRFDNPIPAKDGYQDRGGFWAPVEIWHQNVEHWSKNLYQRGMRVLVQGSMISQEWSDEEGRARTIMKVEARRIAILPHRVESVTVTQKSSDEAEQHAPETPELPDDEGTKVAKNINSRSSKEIKEEHLSSK